VTAFILPSDQPVLDIDHVWEPTSGRIFVIHADTQRRQQIDGFHVPQQVNSAL
jgi:hypothetical protein